MNGGSTRLNDLSVGSPRVPRSLVSVFGWMQDSRGASFVNGCETTVAQSALGGRGHFCGGAGAVS